MEPRDLEKTLAADVLREAKEIVSGYSIILEPNQEFGFTGTAIEFRTVLGRGQTPEDCYKDTQECLMIAAASMIEQGKRLPQPAAREKRDKQVNIRLNIGEERVLRSVALTLGFRGVSDLVRNVALKYVANVMFHGKHPK